MATRQEIDALSELDVEELLELLGAQAVPLVADPLSVLEQLEANAFRTEYDSVLGGEKRKPAGFFLQVGRTFLKNFKTRLQTAVCKNADLRAHESKRTSSNIDLFVAAVIAAVVASIPALRELTGLLTLLGVMVAKSGIDTFCELLGNVT